MAVDQSLGYLLGLLTTFYHPSIVFLNVLFCFHKNIRGFDPLLFFIYRKCNLLILLSPLEVPPRSEVKIHKQQKRFHDLEHQLQQAEVDVWLPGGRGEREVFHFFCKVKSEEAKSMEKAAQESRKEEAINEDDEDILK